MGVILVGAGSGVGAETGVAAAAPIHSTNKPVPYGALGHYRYGGFTGIIAAGTGSSAELFQFRWTDATRLALVMKVKISAVVSTTFFAAGVPVQIDMVKCTGWSVAGSGGTRPTITTLMKMRTSMGHRYRYHGGLDRRHQEPGGHLHRRPRGSRADHRVVERGHLSARDDPVRARPGRR